jgi:hypothetical protein
LLFVPLLRVMILAGLAAAGLATRPASAEATREWDRLPDGRVVIEIYGRRFAFPADMKAGQVEFVHGYQPDRTRPASTVARTATLDEVIADRAAAERWWAGPFVSRPVTIVLPASLAEPLFYGSTAAVDRGAVQPDPMFIIEVYRDPARTHCNSREFESQRRACDLWLSRSRNASAMNPEGFIVDRRGPGETYYFFPEHERRSQAGDPTHIRCVEYPGSFICGNGTVGADGYYLWPGIVLRYRYFMSKTDRQDMRRIDDAYRAVAARFFLGDAGEGR